MGKDIHNSKYKNYIASYEYAQEKRLAKICTTLRKEIDESLSKATSKIYYAMPVWFINENPIVGYKAKSNYVNLLFWSGQLFVTKGLIAAGKYKAAQIKYRDVSEIDFQLLRHWLRESKTKIWDYKKPGKK